MHVVKKGDFIFFPILQREYNLALERKELQSRFDGPFFEITGFQKEGDKDVITFLPYGEAATKLARDLDFYSMTEYTRDYLIGSTGGREIQNKPPEGWYTKQKSQSEQYIKK